MCFHASSRSAWAGDRVIENIRKKVAFVTQILSTLGKRILLSEEGRNPTSANKNRKLKINYFKGK
jgi:hypothetical protein